MKFLWFRKPHVLYIIQDPDALLFEHIECNEQFLSAHSNDSIIMTCIHAARVLMNAQQFPSMTDLSKLCPNSRTIHDVTTSDLIGGNLKDAK
jgi:hypothetical protein